MRLIHLSDPHLTSPEHSLTGRSHWGKRHLGRASWRRRRRFRHRREWLDRLTAEVHAAAPDLIVLTGDLAHVGLPEEIAEAAVWLEELGPPERVFLVPGNHDDYAADSRAAIAEHWGSYLGSGAPFPLTRRAAGVEVIGLNTALPTRPASACGLVGATQLEALGRELATAKPGPRVLALHHPPFPGMISYRKRLRDAAALEACVAGRGVDVVLHGHDHTDRTALRAGARVYGVSSASYRRGSYRALEFDEQDGGWRVEMQLFSRRGDGFAQVERDTWTLEV